VLAAALLTPTGALAERQPTERYDSHRAGHPLRLAGYVGHAAGVVLDLLIFRPAWALGHYEPLYTLFGRYHNRTSREEPLEQGAASSLPAREPEGGAPPD
jgi:hypothetical protein